MATATSNQITNIATVIDGAMSGAIQEGNRQAQLTKYMFDDAANYGEKFCNDYINAKGQDKVTLVDRALSKMSDKFMTTLQQIEEIKEKKEKTKNDGLKIERLMSGIRAAREMFKRAVTSLVFLRHMDVSDLKVRSDGGLTITAKNTETGEDEIDILSGRALKTKGDKTISEITGKSNARTQPNNANASRDQGMMNSFSSSVKYLQAMDKPIDDLSDELSSELDKLLVTLLRKKFEHEKKVQLRDLVEFIEDEIADVEVENNVPQSHKPGAAKKPGMTAAQAEKRTAKPVQPEKKAAKASA